LSAPGWWRYDAAGRVLTVLVHVQPNARTTAAGGLHDGALKIRVGAPAVDNKANAALIEFFAAKLGVVTKNVTLRRGAHGRRKTLEVRDAGPEALRALEALGS
jgi:uncharacterized protein (TIGR00251 family)